MRPRVPGPMSVRGWRLPGLGADPDGSGVKQGKRVLVAEICAPTLVVCHLEGATTTTETGRIMHFVYVLSGVIKRPGVNVGARKEGPMEVRFNAVGSHALNHRGTLYLADGNPSDTYEGNIMVLPLDRQMLQWHPLTARATGRGYQMPPAHSKISGHEALGFRSGPIDDVLGLCPMPVGVAQNVTVEDADGTIVTAWFG